MTVGNPVRRNKILAICKERNITVTKLKSGCYWLTGPGTDIVVRELEWITEVDLRPCRTANG